jgi:hypothetical protein
MPQLLLVDADEHEPALKSGASLPRTPAQPRQELPKYLWDESNHPNDLQEQRWAVIAPEGPEGDALIELVRPLIAVRAQQQGAPVREYRVPPRMRADEAAQWKKQVFEASEPHRMDLPRYQLIVGDLHQVSVDLQTIQATDGFVGRLAFDDPRDYTAYVDKLLAAEGKGGTGGARAVFHTVHDGTPATTIGHQALVEPGAVLARQMQARRQASFPGEVVVSGDEADPHPEEFPAAARPGCCSRSVTARGRRAGGGARPPSSARGRGR